MDLPVLSPVEVRVAGALIEKEITTPDNYPLSLNALVNACNQISNRDPVMACSEAEVTRALDLLREKHLAYVVSGGDSRVLKFGHKVAATLELKRSELALLCTLLLRGPQTVGELRGRSARMHEFADLPDVQATLGRLADRPAPLAACLPRQPGTKESRYAQLLGGEVVLPVPTAPAAFTAPLSPETEHQRQLEAEIAGLKRDLADLRREFTEFRQKFE